MDGIVPILFLLVILKIPVFAGIYLVYWAFTQEPEIEEDAPPAAEEHGFRRWRKSPRKPPRGPKGPRRGGHGGGAIALPDQPAHSLRRGPHRREPSSVPGHRR
jgi:hypothetical protein